MHRPYAMLLAVLLITVGANTVRAETATPAASADQAAPTVCPICGRANDPNADYPTKASHTLARGTTNLLLGWTEVIQRPAEEAKAGRNVFGGILQGLGQGVWRTAVGAGELLTFWTPKGTKDYMRMAENCPLCMGRQPKP